MTINEPGIDTPDLDAIALLTRVRGRIFDALLVVIEARRALARNR